MDITHCRNFALLLLKNVIIHVFLSWINNRTRQIIFNRVKDKTMETRPNYILVNLILGTVIDTDIVSPNGFDFYLNSHAAIQGTSRPMLYQILYDEIMYNTLVTLSKCEIYIICLFHNKFKNFM